MTLNDLKETPLLEKCNCSWLGSGTFNPCTQEAGTRPAWSTEQVPGNTITEHKQTTTTNPPKQNANKNQVNKEIKLDVRTCSHNTLLERWV